MRSVLRTFALAAACILPLTACSSDDGDDGGQGGSSNGGSSNGGSSNGGSSNGGSSNGGSGGGMDDCTRTGCPNDETCSQCLGVNGEIVNACIPEGVACN